MSEKFLGVPFFVWGAICLALAVVWVFVWPGDKAGPAGTTRYFILRWFHAAVWLLLAVAAALRGLNNPWANPVALLSLVVYLIFMGSLLLGK